MPDKFKISNDLNNIRFDRWFKENILNVPNSLFQKLLRKNIIKVNKKRAKSSLRLKKGDEVVIYNISKYKPTNLKKKISYIPAKYEKNKLENLIIHDDENYVVVNKPRGIAVQSGTKILKNIIDILKKTKYFINCKPYVVHRLDKETSGVMIVAKNKEYAQFFTSLFRLRKIHKTYIAIVKGNFPTNLKKMEDMLEYYENKRKLSLKAITTVKIIKQNNNFSLLELNPITGRKHQLRKQLFSRGFPIIGDEKYYSYKKINYNNNQNMLLHAFKLRFMKNNLKFTYTADLDINFQKKISLYFR